jgi:uncharacterized protein DUF1236
MCSVFRTEHNELRGVLYAVIRDQKWNCGTILRGETQMRRNEKTLLAGVAALALITGTGLATAQQGMSGNGGTAGMSQGSTAQHAQGGMKAGESKSEGAGGMTAKSPQNAQQSTAQKGGKADLNRNAEERGKTDKDLNRRAEQKGEKNFNRSAEERGKTDRDLNRSAEQNGEKTFNRSAEKGAADKNFNHENRGATAQQERSRNGRMNAAERRENNIPKGLQGNASKPMQGQETENRQRTSGGNIQLSQEQRTRIRSTVIDSRSAPRVGHVDFDVSVGTHVPRHIHFAAVPETLVSIQPEWRGYRYFVYEDEIVIVDPHDLTIVAVVSV